MGRNVPDVAKQIERYEISPLISLVKGDILDTMRNTIVIPVNTVGIMGKGLALQFKARYPSVCEKYVQSCGDKLLTVNTPAIFPMPNDRRVVFFATKKHWRDDSKLEYVLNGLVWLKDNCRDKITSLAIPALGCGLGKLDWNDVWPLIIETALQVSIPVDIYLPDILSTPIDEFIDSVRENTGLRD